MTVSVVTVCRNAASLIADTMRSVMSQDYPDIEYIIVDGASTDGTQSFIQTIIDAYQSVEGRTFNFRFVSEPDNGIYDAMNKAIRMAQGEWINFMNAGDMFASTHVLTDIFASGGYLSSVQSPSAITVIGGNTVNFYPDGREDVHHAEDASVIPYRLPFSHQASFVRIQPDSFCFGMNFPMAADYKLFYDIYHAYGSSAFLIIDYPIARYRQEDSLTMDPSNRHRLTGEYLHIQSAHRTWHWWKQYLKWRLF